MYDAMPSNLSKITLKSVMSNTIKSTSKIVPHTSISQEDNISQALKIVPKEQILIIVKQVGLKV